MQLQAEHVLQLHVNKKGPFPLGRPPSIATAGILREHTYRVNNSLRGEYACRSL